MSAKISHSVIHRLKAWLGTMEFNLCRKNFLLPGINVVNYHGTQKKFLENFEEQLLFYRNNFNIISPAVFKQILLSGTLPEKANFLLLTFDDGIKNNLYAAEVLRKYDLKALFFVVPGFIDTARHEQKDFFLKKVRPTIDPQVDSANEDFESMSWEDLRQLKSEGHEIGCHTYNHTLESFSSSQENSLFEIVVAGKVIEEKLQTPIDCFCSINNTLVSIGRFEKKLIAENYKFHFTTLPGINLTNAHLFVKRRNVEAHWLQGAIKFSLGKWTLKRWKKRISLFNEL